MNYSAAIFLVSDRVRAVHVSYEPGPNGSAPKTYIFKSLDDTLAPGDMVVVPTNTRHNFTVCRVEYIDTDFSYDTDLDLKWIVGKVDLLSYADILDQETLAINKIRGAEKRRKRAELRDALLADAGEELKTIPIFADETEKEKG